MIETILWRTYIAFQLLLFVAGHEMYDPFNEICCKGKLHPQMNSNGSYQQCCGDNVIIVPYYSYYQQDNNTRRSLCCDGVVQHSQNNYEDCCGKELIDTQKFACFNKSEKIDIPDSYKLNDELNICGKSKSELEFYNAARNVCCDGTLYEINNSQTCCGDKYVSPTTHKMCYTFNRINLEFGLDCKAIPLDGRSMLNTQCCDNYDLYNFRDQICLKKKIFNKTETPTPKCCGYTYTYNSTFHYWTTEENENELNDEDCDQFYLRSKEGVCVQNKLIRQNENVSYCFWDSSNFNPHSQACCSGGVQNRTEDEISSSKSECCEAISQSTLYQKLAESQLLNYQTQYY